MSAGKAAVRARTWPHLAAVVAITAIGWAVAAIAGAPWWLVTAAGVSFGVALIGGLFSLILSTISAGGSSSAPNAQQRREPLGRRLILLAWAGPIACLAWMAAAGSGMLEAPFAILIGAPLTTALVSSALVVTVRAARAPQELVDPAVPGRWFVGPTRYGPTGYFIGSQRVVLIGLAAATVLALIPVVATLISSIVLVAIALVFTLFAGSMAAQGPSVLRAAEGGRSR